MSTLPLPGLHYGVPYEDYAKWDAANFSTVKNIHDTASKCKYAMDHPKSRTEAIDNGSALHVATFEPGRFDGLFHICPPCKGNTTEGKQILEHHTALAEQAGKILIREKHEADKSKLEAVAAYREMAKAIWKSKAARLFLECAGQNEVALLCHDAEADIFRKAKVDRFIPQYAELGCDVVIELKSTRDASATGFYHECKKNFYFEQAANYVEMAQRITGKRPAHIIIAIENFAPWDLQVHLTSDTDLQRGLLRYREWLLRFSECKKLNLWPGYPDKINTLQQPVWEN